MRRCPGIGVAAASVAVAVVVAGCTSGGAETPGGGSGGAAVAPGRGPAPPAAGAYFGAWVKPPDLSQPSRYAAVETRERELGRPFDIVNTYRTWHEDFPKESDNRFMSGGRFMMLSWNGIDTKEIASGAQDKVIRQRARALKKLGKPLFLRWQWEMERPNIRNKIHSAADYIAAWKHIRAVFAEERVTNASWVWCPTAKGFGPDRAGDYYPGDDQVDWICVDAYPGLEYDYRDLADVLAPFMAWAKGHPSKPIMIGEYGVPRSYGPRRAEWLGKAAAVLRNPRIKAVLYYDSDQEGKGRGVRRAYALDGDPAALAAMRAIATARHFNPRRLPVRDG
jgi:hypothetical protein